MIKTKKDLKKYLLADKYALCKDYKRPKLWLDEIWKYQICLRKLEYHRNNNHLFARKLYLWMVIRRGLKLGISMPPVNIFGPGLRIVHPFDITISEKAKVGKNCIIFQGVTLGCKYMNYDCGNMVLGNNVVVCAGAKIIGNVKIANDVVIAANSVVINDILEPNTTWGGIPAKKISNKGSSNFYYKKYLDKIDRIIP